MTDENRLLVDDLERSPLSQEVKEKLWFWFSKTLFPHIKCRILKGRARGA